MRNTTGYEPYDLAGSGVRGVVWSGSGLERGAAKLAANIIMKMVKVDVIVPAPLKSTFYYHFGGHISAPPSPHRPRLSRPRFAAVEGSGVTGVPRS